MTYSGLTPGKKYKVVGTLMSKASGKPFTVNGKELTSDVYSITGYTEDYGDMDYPLTLGEGEYFCMGDNRPQSFDCRYKEVGTVHKNEFIGKVWIRIWPLSKFGKVD